MRLTTKGQVTIPQAIRDKLGLMPFTEVVFDVVGDSVRIRKASGDRGRGRAIVDRLRGAAPAGRRGTGAAMTTDEIMALTRGE